MKAHRHPYHQRSGAVLVITLCMLVLISVVVLAYFSQAVLNRQTSFSSAGQTRAQMLALSAMDVIQGNLLTEMSYGSTNNTLSGLGQTQTVLFPLANTTMVPNRLATVSGLTNLITWSGGGSNMWTATSGYTNSGPILAASGAPNSTATASLNGRYIDPSRWSKPDFGSYPASAVPNWVLLSRQGVLATNAIANLPILGNSSSTNSSYVVGRFAFAVYNEGGLIDVAAGGYPSSMPTAAVAPKGNLGYADLTQLGVSTNDVNTLVNWRNATTAASTSAYTNYLGGTNGFASQYGFMRAAPGDNAFVSRQDLIKFWSSNLSSSTNLLQYFTTFTREKNSPSWSPLLNAAAMGGANSGLNTAAASTNISSLGTNMPTVFSYADNADNPSSIAYNRRLYNVTVTGTFTRWDGTTAVVGEPLIKQRFDLSKLAWLSYNGYNGLLPANTPGFSSAAAAATAIYQYFGLTLNTADGSWTYNHTSVTQPGTVTATDHIYSLFEVQAAHREADYFELLQAGILQGSMGLCNGDPTSPTGITLNGTIAGINGGDFYRMTGGSTWQAPLSRTDINGFVVYAQPKYQVIQIGANMIDQSHTDSYPTDISLNGEHFYGIQNLPYINALGQTCLRAAPNAATGSTSAATVASGTILKSTFESDVHQWMTVSLWNPHQNAGTLNANGPTKFRVYVGYGQVTPVIFALPVIGGEPAPGVNTPLNYGQTEDFGLQPSWIQFALTNYAGYFSTPTTLNYSNSVTSDPSGCVSTILGWQRAGIYLGFSFSPDCTNKIPDSSLIGNTYFPNSVATNFPGYNAAHLTEAEPPVVDLQYQDTASSTTWHTYQEMRGVLLARDGRGDSYMEPSDPFWANWNNIVPHTNLTTYQMVGSAAGAHLATNVESWGSSPLDPRSPRLNLTSTPNLILASTADSSAEGTGAAHGPNFPFSTYVSSGGWYAAGGANLAWQNWISNSAAGYYYTDRDFVRRPGDATWLGADPLLTSSTASPVILNRPFRSVGEIGYTFRDDPWKTLNLFTTNSADAGLLDLFCIGSNTTNAPPSIVAGKVDLNSASAPVLQALISGAQMDTSGTTLISTYAQAFSTNLAFYVANSGPLINKAQIPGVFPQSTALSISWANNKYQRESLIRAVADATTTRTWNLMIDVIAQSGRFKPNAASLSDFVVEGEKRYWLHVAIDRFTGQIIDEQLEPVQER